MQPDDVYELTGVGDPRLSPDGSRVAYVVSTTDREASEYRSAIWVAQPRRLGRAARFTTGEKRDGSPRWSPDGRWLAFVSNRGDEKAQGQIYVIPAEGGEARKLTDLKESVSRRHLVARLDAASRSRSRVRDEAYEEEDDRSASHAASPACSTSSTASASIGDRRTHVFVVDLEGGEATPGHRRRLRGRRTRRGRPTARSSSSPRRAASGGTPS